MIQRKIVSTPMTQGDYRAKKGYPIERFPFANPDPRKEGYLFRFSYNTDPPKMFEIWLSKEDVDRYKSLQSQVLSFDI
jgi:hypothetical protein